MAIHRATATSGSAAEARFRASNDIGNEHIFPDSEFSPYPAYNACDRVETASRNAQPQAGPAVDHHHHQYDPQQTPPICYDQTQPLLPTTRLHSSAAHLDTNDEPLHRYEAEEGTKPCSSGTYIGILCIVFVWLLPIGIIVSGSNHGGDAAVRDTLIPGRSYHPPQLALATRGRGLLSWESSRWDQLRRGEHCLRYRTREYTAKSAGENHGQAGMEECKRSPAQIHDVELKPSFCEDLGKWSGIWGHWVVDFDEPECETSWVDFQDQGCQGTAGRRRITAHLDRFNHGDDWQIMCSTTPPTYLFNGKPLPVPPNCEHTRDSVVGIWDMVDPTCLNMAV